MDPMDKTNHRPQIGQSLTPDQVRNLPDGAIFTSLPQPNSMPEYYRVEDGKLKNGWRIRDNHFQWYSQEAVFESAVLVSLPSEPSRIEPQAELPVWVITCDRCGTTYKNNERHACVARGESGSAQGARVASEIEKECALHALAVLMDDCHDAMTDAMSERDYDYLHDFMVAVDGTFNRYREVYSYARSIGAIE